MASITIKDVLEVKNIDGIRLIAGEKGITNEVHNVNIIENPDSYSWFTAGDLVLTTGYILMGSEQ